MPVWLSTILLIPWNFLVVKPFRWVSTRVGPRPNVSVVVGETHWHGSSPVDDDGQVTHVLVQVGVTNSSSSRGSVSMFRLDIEGSPSYFPAEVQKGSTRGTDLLIPAGGGWASVSARERWLELPVNLGPWESASGWVGFITGMGPAAKMTFRHARSAKGRLVATVAGKGDISAPIRPYPPSET
jgi:hypothetical protein